jgi:PKD repeat protein
MNKKTIFSHFRQLLFVTGILLLVAITVSPASAAEPLTSNRHIFINVANDEGVKWDWDSVYYGGLSTGNNTYYIKADAGGVNELHITNDNASEYGQVTTSNEQSGVFYISNTGGRGFDNDIILLISVQGPIPDDFAVRVKSSGYNWTPATPGAYTPLVPDDYEYIAEAVDETFTKEDFLYGPQTAKPGPGALGVWSLPLYYGQDISEPSTAEYLMFVDLYVGNMYPTKVGVPLENSGAVKVEYSFTHLNTRASFNGYGWCSAANQDEGISWTNRVINGDSTSSGYSVIGQPSLNPVPLPGQTNPPTDPDGDGLYEDLSGNGSVSFVDVNLFFQYITWIISNEPVAAFDFTGNGSVSFVDVVRLFHELSGG